MNLNASTFAFAFRVGDFLTGKSLDDPSMVRWVAEIVETDGERFWTERKPVGTHKCSKEDKAKFYNPRNG